MCREVRAYGSVYGARTFTTLPPSLGEKNSCLHEKKNKQTNGWVMGVTHSRNNNTGTPHSSTHAPHSSTHIYHIATLNILTPDNLTTHSTYQHQTINNACNTIFTQTTHIQTPTLCHPDIGYIWWRQGVGWGGGFSVFLRARRSAAWRRARAM